MKKGDIVKVCDKHLGAFGHEGTVHFIDGNYVEVNFGFVTTDFSEEQLVVTKEFVLEFQDGWRDKNYEDLTQNEKKKLGREFNGDSGGRF